MSIKDPQDLSEQDKFMAIRAIYGVEVGQLPEEFVELESLLDRDSDFAEYKYRRRVAELELFRRWFLDQDITYKPMPCERPISHEWQFNGRGFA